MNELDEIRQDVVQRTASIQNQRNKWHDKFLKKKTFEEGDWALLFGSWFKHFKGKLTTRWMGPYEIVIVFYNGSIKIRTIDEEQATFVVNGHRLKVYHKPLSKQEFIHNTSQQSELELVGEEMTSSSLTFSQ